MQARLLAVLMGRNPEARSPPRPVQGEGQDQEVQGAEERPQDRLLPDCVLRSAQDRRGRSCLCRGWLDQLRITNPADTTPRPDRRGFLQPERLPMLTYQAVSSTGYIHVEKSRRPLRLCVIGANRARGGGFAVVHVSCHRSDKQATRVAKSLVWKFLDSIETLTLEEIPND